MIFAHPHAIPSALCHSKHPLSFRAERGISSPSGALHNLVIPTKVGIQKDCQVLN